MLPHLEGKGDLQAAGHMTLSGELVGVHSQLAYAINDDWGVQATACVLTTGEFNASPINRFRSYEAGVLRMFAPEMHGKRGVTYVLQAGLGFSEASLRAGYRPALIFNQNHLFVQGSSRHQLSEFWALGVGLRLGITEVNWVEQPGPPKQGGWPPTFTEQQQLYLEARPLFWLANPIFQLEYCYTNYVLTFTAHPAYVINQPYIEYPVGPLNFGFRWHFSR